MKTRQTGTRKRSEGKKRKTGGIELAVFQSFASLSLCPFIRSTHSHILSLMLLFTLYFSFYSSLHLSLHVQSVRFMTSTVTGVQCEFNLKGKKKYEWEVRKRKGRKNSLIHSQDSSEKKEGTSFMSHDTRCVCMCVCVCVCVYVCLCVCVCIYIYMLTSECSEYSVQCTVYSE